MDLEDTKALIRSLVISEKNYSVRKLLVDFRNETGTELPTYNFGSRRAFLESLSDIIQIIGQPPREEIRLVESDKSKHIASLVKRQGRMSKCRSQDIHIPEIEMFPNLNDNALKTSVKDKKISGVMARLPVKQNKQAKVEEKKREVVIEPVTDFIFKEEEIPSIFQDQMDDIQRNSRTNSDNLFEDSDVYSVTDSLSSGSTSSSCTKFVSFQSAVSDGVRAKLKELIKKQSQGIWCSDLPELYKQCFNVPLDFREFGYRSLIEMLMELTEIFRCIRPDSGDWLLFDASKGPSPEEEELRLRSLCKVPEEVEKKISQLLDSYFENPSHKFIYIEDFLILYFKKYREKLNFLEMGFQNLRKFLNRFTINTLKLQRSGSRWIIEPFTQKIFSDDTSLTITPEDDLFVNFFPDNVVQPCEKFPILEIEKEIVIGQVTEVIVADVWSPTKFYLQLKKYKADLSHLMENLQIFYSKSLTKYKMPEATLQPHQICVGLHKVADGAEEWYRAVIVKLRSKDEVTLNFIDYGTIAHVPKAHVRFMHRDFLELPVQAFAAKLDSIKPCSGGEWPIEASRKFLQLLLEPISYFLVTDIDHEHSTVKGKIFSVIEGERKNINKLLVKEGLAAWVVEPHAQTQGHWNSNGSNEEVGLTEEAVSVEEAEPTNNDRAIPVDVSNGIYSMQSNPNEREAKTPTVEPDVPLSDTENANFSMPATEKSFDGSKETNTINETKSPPVYISNDKICERGECEQTKIRREWTVQKEVFAEAFELMIKNEEVKCLAQKNLDQGLQLASFLAEKQLLHSDNHC